jgi:hypothetical protein
VTGVADTTDGLGDQEEYRDAVDDISDDADPLTVIPLALTTGEYVLTTVPVPALSLVTGVADRTDGLGDQEEWRDGVDDTTEEADPLTVIPLALTTGESVFSTVAVPALSLVMGVIDINDALPVAVDTRDAV